MRFEGPGREKMSGRKFRKRKMRVGRQRKKSGEVRLGAWSSQVKVPKRQKIAIFFM